VLYFNAEDVGSELDDAPGGGDGFVLVKIDGVSGAPSDLDDWLGEVLSYLQTNLDADLTLENLLGAAIKGGQADDSTQFYAVQGNLNGDAPDPVPDGAPQIDYDNPDQGEVPGPSIDHEYSFNAIFA
jgi:hypothetical protein